MKDKDIKKAVEAIKNSNITKNDFDNLKKKAEDMGVMDKVNELNRQYSPKFKQFLKDNNNFKGLNKEEKAQVILDYKKQLTPEEQRQFDKVLKMIKSYAKKMK